MTVFPQASQSWTFRSLQSFMQHGGPRAWQGLYGPSGGFPGLITPDDSIGLARTLNVALDPMGMYTTEARLQAATELAFEAALTVSLMVATPGVPDEALVGTSAFRRAPVAEAISTQALEASSATNAALLRNQLISEEIAGGHAFDKHVILKGEFPGISTRAQFASEIEDLLNSPDTIMRNLTKGRSVFWNDFTRTVLVRNPAAIDGGTYFVPDEGINYFWGL
jgi:hypothetical protein